MGRVAGYGRFNRGSRPELDGRHVIFDGIVNRTIPIQTYIEEGERNAEKKPVKVHSDCIFCFGSDGQTVKGSNGKVHARCARLDYEHRRYLNGGGIRFQAPNGCEASPECG